MATKRMLIDAAHPEETRVVVLDGNRLEDYDVEVATRRQLKGNIYLAKVTRVEPSLQAAFVDYGGNRHGFLAFNEIHPDYYQIPVADREALSAEHEAAERAAARAEENGEAESEGLDTIGDDDEELVARPVRPSPRHYKIQEVIKRRQILLVQVVKEERGTKGAALTTYLSLAGRYCVLMPNTARGGGISRKISQGADRKRLKSIIADLEVPDGMAVIVRTAGAQRSKAEIKRDYEYLLRQWGQVRQLTLESMAPALVHEEGSLIKRAIRDLYSREIEEIIVDGDEAYRTAREFMKLLTPSHTKRVKLYEEGDMPLFHRYRVENELDAMHQPVVQLRSGGYIVINPTEALVSIDVNSGRSTRERNIEETALRTNLESADEIARQLRQRDLAGLIVIDFIDMENARNQGQVERRLKEAMKTDRARIQIGRISPFGLLELSRQRLRPSLLETSFEVCSHCGGAGVRRTTESTALSILRRIEDEGIARRAGAITVHMPTAVALYILNQKRRTLMDIEGKYDFAVAVAADDSLTPPDIRIDRVRPPAVRDEEADDERAEAAADGGEAEERDDSSKRKRRRRPRRRKRAEDEAETTVEAGAEDDGDEAETEPGEAAAQADGEADADDDSQAKKRRRGRRGSRRRSRRTGEAREAEEATEAEEPAEPEAEAFELPAPGTELEGPAELTLLAAGEAAPPADEPDTAEAPPKKPARRRTTRGRGRAAAAPEAPEAAEAAEETPPEAAPEAPEVIYAPAPAEAEAEPETPPAPAKTRSRRRKPAAAAAAAAEAEAVAAEDAGAAAEPEPEPATEGEGPDTSRTTVIDVDDAEPAAEKQPQRRGWWRRALG